MSELFLLIVVIPLLSFMTQAMLSTPGAAAAPPPDPSVDLAALAGATCACDGAGCGICSDCDGAPDGTGQMWRTQWDETNCNDTLHHVAIHRSIDGGSFVEVLDNQACNGAVNGCSLLSGRLTRDGCWMECDARCGVGTTFTEDRQYRVRIEDDGTDTLAAAGATADTTTVTQTWTTNDCLQ